MRHAKYGNGHEVVRGKDVSPEKPMNRGIAGEGEREGVALFFSTV